MINQLKTPYYYDNKETTCVNKALATKKWESQTNCIKDLKKSLNKHFDNVQDEKCCYCGLLYDRTGRGEIEHIAPKESYEDFSFTPKNLAKACQLCNSSTMKHTFDTIDVYNNDYEKSTFKIVHPYLDDHSYHYNWKYGLNKVIISINNNSLKAKKSIEIFELASEKRTRARATQRNQERLEKIYNITDIIRERIKKVLLF